MLDSAGRTLPIHSTDRLGPELPAQPENTGLMFEAPAKAVGLFAHVSQNGRGRKRIDFLTIIDSRTHHRLD